MAQEDEDQGGAARGQGRGSTGANMSTLRAFLGGIVDYAGIYPPARLGLDEAVRNYARYREEPDGWMLGRFIIPAARLPELAAYHDDFFAKAQQPWRLAVQAGGDAREKGNENDALTRLRTDAAQLRALRDRHSPALAIESLEIRLPEETFATGNQERVARYIKSCSWVLAEEDATGPELFLEIPLSGPASRDPERWRAGVEAATLGVTRAVGSLVGGTGSQGERWANGHRAFSRVGLKIRCGGEESTAFPPVTRVAAVIVACRDVRVPLKATAGLHHPLRRWSQEFGAHMHGFVNVFGAALLACTANLPPEQIAACLEEESPTAFRFDEDGFGWRTHLIDQQRIASGRRDFAVAFGSCSFDTPRHDLRALGLLPAAKVEG
jgi:hypothetical protein